MMMDSLYNTHNQASLPMFILCGIPPAVLITKRHIAKGITKMYTQKLSGGKKITKNQHTREQKMKFHSTIAVFYFQIEIIERRESKWDFFFNINFSLFENKWKKCCLADFDGSLVQCECVPFFCFVFVHSRIFLSRCSIDSYIDVPTWWIKWR